MQQLVTAVRTDDGPMDVHLFLPDGTGTRKRRGVLVFQEAFGVNGHILRVCERLAAEGYLAAAPELYHRAGRGTQFGYGEFEKVRPVMAQLTNEKLLADVRAAHGFLVSRPEVDPRRVASIGFCLGGFVSALTACHLPVGAAVAFYGGGLARARPGMGMRPLLDDFSRLDCPTLFVFGEKDQAIPAADVATVRTRLKELQKPHEIVVYPGVGHGFFCEERSSYHPATARTAWEMALHWFDTHLAH